MTDIIIDNYRGWDIFINSNGHLCASYPDEGRISNRRSHSDKILADLKDQIDRRLTEIADQQAQAAQRAAQEAAQKAAVKARGPKPKAPRGYAPPEDGKCLYIYGEQALIKSLRRQRGVKSWLVHSYIKAKFETVATGREYNEDLMSGSTMVMTPDDWEEYRRVHDEQAKASHTLAKLQKRFVVKVNCRIKDQQVEVSTTPNEDSPYQATKVTLPFAVAPHGDTLEWTVPGTTVRHTGDVSGFLRKVGNAALEQSNFEALDKWDFYSWSAEARCSAVHTEGRDRYFSAKDKYAKLNDETVQRRDAGYAAYKDYVDTLLAPREAHRHALDAWEAS